MSISSDEEVDSGSDIVVRRFRSVPLVSDFDSDENNSDVERG